MSAPVLTTKLCPPIQRANLVPRPRLVQRLNADLRQPEGFTRRLTLICAPAGYGKTTLAVEWLRSSSMPFTWLSLDEGDNDARRFLIYLIAAFRQIQAEIGEEAQSLLQAAQPAPPEAILPGLVNDIAGLGTPFLLALDDYHSIHTPPVHQAINFLLEYQPANMHMAIVTREDPPIPIVRLRARGQMREMRQNDLRFTPQEASVFFRHSMDLELHPEDVQALAKRTEGWAAGLHMAALSMRATADRRGFVQSFMGSSRYILDYLFEEVLTKQPAGVQEFLLKTSIPNRLCAPLCDAITGGGDSFAFLQELERANLFMEGIDPSFEWYRYHPLFRELLYHRLQLISGGGVPGPISETELSESDLHARASLWFEANGFPEDAVQHAISAGDWGRVAGLVTGLIDAMLKRGEFTTLIGWFKRMPEGVIRSNPRLCLAYAWPLLLASQLEPAETLLAHAEKQAGDGTPLQGEIDAAQAYLAQVRGDGLRLMEYSERALRLLPESNLTARGLVALNLGLAYWHSGRLEEAEKALEIALPASRSTGNDYAVATALIFRARSLAVRGQLHRARTNLQQILATGPHVPILALAHFDLGTLSYEWNDLPRAAEHILEGLEACQQTGNVEFRISGLMLLARLRYAQGDTGGGLKALQQALQVDPGRHAPLRAGARLAALQVERALAQGDLEEASRWSQDIPEDAEMHPFYRFLGLAKVRLLIAQGRKGEAAQVLQDRFTKAIRAGWEYGALAARVLQALAADQPQARLEFLTDALRRGQPEGYVRTFVDAGDGLVPLLIQAAQGGVAPGYVGQILAAMRARHGPHIRPSPPHGEPTPQPASGPLVEALSERELEVLRLVAAGLSNREIAEKIYVSPGTAKTHIHHICGKLGVRNRTEATARAKELGLV